MVILHKTYIVGKLSLPTRCVLQDILQKQHFVLYGIRHLHYVENIAILFNIMYLLVDKVYIMMFT